jgi:hypothetical protein
MAKKRGRVINDLTTKTRFISKSPTGGANGRSVEEDQCFFTLNSSQGLIAYETQDGEDPNKEKK